MPRSWIRPVAPLLASVVAVVAVLAVLGTAPAGSADQVGTEATPAGAGDEIVQLGPRRRVITGDGRTRYRHRRAVLRPTDRVALPPKVRMRAWLVADAETGAVLAHRDSDRVLPVASLTKLLTALTAVEQVPPGRHRAPRWAAQQTCSCAGVKAGRRYTRGALLTGALLPSGNDAAEALAAAHPRGRWGFYAAMDDVAARLGARRTHAGNASGLTTGRGYSTARDMAIILEAALRRPALARLLGTRTSARFRPAGGRARLVPQKTHYVQTYADSAGKAGYTSAALNTLAVQTTVDGHRFTVVTLGAPGGYSTSGTRALAEWAAAHRDLLRPVGRL